MVRNSIGDSSYFRTLMFLTLFASFPGCHDGVFGRPIGAYCKETSDCRAPYVCAYGRCRAECKSDDDCIKGACVESHIDPKAGVCTVASESGCKTIEDCPEGLYCGADAICRTGCDDNDDCQGEKICFSNTCFDTKPNVEVDAGDDSGTDAGVRDGKSGSREAGATGGSSREGDGGDSSIGKADAGDSSMDARDTGDDVEQTDTGGSEDVKEDDTGGSGGDDGGDSGETGGARSSGGTGGVGGSNGSGGAASEESDYDGRWIGLNSQGMLFKLDTFANAVTGVTFDWSVYVSSTGCLATGETSSTFGTPASIDGSGQFSKGPVSGNPVSYTVSGTFTSPTVATGTVNMTHTATNCTGSETLSWTAQKVVYGNGQIEWPETCDDGNQTPGDGCSELCQLTPTVEQEPNDSIATAGDAITTDAVFTGSISSTTDHDYFAIRNPYPGSIAIGLETHGETMGTCHVDTLLDVYNSGGELLAEDDDGARAWFCSQLTIQLTSGQTVYVRISSPVSETITVYNLHVRFPHS